MFNKIFLCEIIRLLNLFDLWVCKVCFLYKIVDDNVENIVDLMIDILELICCSMKFYYSILMLYLIV